jgi:hypothetical protein
MARNMSSDSVMLAASMFSCNWARLVAPMMA